MINYILVGRIYKNTKMTVSLEVGMFIPSNFARKNSLIVPTSC